MGDIGGSQDRDQHPGGALGDVARDRAAARRRISPYASAPYYENQRKHDSPYHEPENAAAGMEAEEYGPRHLMSRSRARKRRIITVVIVGIAVAGIVPLVLAALGSNI